MMRRAKKTETHTKNIQIGALCLFALAFLMALPRPVYGQSEEVEEEQSVDPRLLLSNADNFYRIAKDKVQTQSGDPTADFNEAVDYFNQYLEADPSISFGDSSRVYSLIADSYYSLSQWAEDNGAEPVWQDAITYYEWLIEREPPNEDIAFDHFCAAWAKSRLEGWNAGTPHLEKYLELRPDDLEKRLWVAQIYLSLANINRALDHFLIYLEANPANQDVVTRILDLRNRLVMRYEEITLKLIEHLPDTPQYLLDISQYYLSRAQYEEHLDYLNRYTEKQPDNISAWKLMGDEFERRGEYDQALNSYRKILSINSRDVRARCDMSSVYLDQGKIDQAIDEAERALAIDPESPYANMIMGDAGQQWAMREFERRYPGLEIEKMKYDFKTLLKKLADNYYEKVKRNPQFRTYAQNQINYLRQFFPQNSDRFMWPTDKDHIIPFPPPR